MSSPRSPHCLCVRNLHYKTTDDELLTLLRAFCNPTNVHIVRDRSSGQAKGYGFVSLSSEEETVRGLRLHGMKLLGNVLIVERAKEDSRISRRNASVLTTMEQGQHDEDSARDGDYGREGNGDDDGRHPRSSRGGGRGGRGGGGGGRGGFAGKHHDAPAGKKQQPPARGGRDGARGIRHFDGADDIRPFPIYPREEKLGGPPKSSTELFGNPTPYFEDQQHGPPHRPPYNDYYDRHGPPPHAHGGGYAPPPPAGYGPPPQGGGYGGPPPPHGYGRPPPPQGYGGYGPPTQGGPPPQQQPGYGGPPPPQGYGGPPPPPQGYGGPAAPSQGGPPPPVQGYRGPPPGQDYGPPPGQGFPPSQNYGPPPGQGYGPPTGQVGYGGPPPSQYGYSGPPGHQQPAQGYAQPQESYGPPPSQPNQDPRFGAYSDRPSRPAPYPPPTQQGGGYAPPTHPQGATQPQGGYAPTQPQGGYVPMQPQPQPQSWYGTHTPSNPQQLPPREPSLSKVVLGGVHDEVYDPAAPSFALNRQQQPPTKRY